MNDLAEKALQGLAAARREAVARPLTSLGVLGFLVSFLVVVAGGAVAALAPTRSLTSWFGLLGDHGLGRSAAATLLLVAVLCLLALWLFTVAAALRGAVSETAAWRLLAAFGLPFALGPPLLDTAVYSSAAFGFVQRSGDSPYDRPPSSLDGNPLVDAIDPAARGTESIAGPLGSVLQHLAVPVGGGTPLGAVIVLRIVGVLAMIAIGRFAADLSSTADARDETARVPRAAALLLTSANPLVLLYVVSSPHLDGPMIAVGLAALVAARRRRWLPAVALAAVAGSLQPPALLLVPVIVLAHLLGRRAAWWRVLVRDVAVVAAVLGAAALAAVDGTSWLRGLASQFAVNTPYSIPYAVGRVLAPVVTGASFDDLTASGRITSAIAAVFAVAYLLVSARHRSTERTAAYALLAIALLAPNLYPWYLLWGLLLLAPVAVGLGRVVVLALTAAGCVLVLPGFADTTAEVVTAIGLAVIAAVSAVGWSRSAPARDLADGGPDVGQVDHGDDHGREREDRRDTER